MNMCESQKIDNFTDLGFEIDGNLMTLYLHIKSRNNPIQIFEYEYVKRLTYLLERQLLLYKAFKEWKTE
jgi:hypothetical protein